MGISLDSEKTPLSFFMISHRGPRHKDNISKLAVASRIV